MVPEHHQGSFESIVAQASLRVHHLFLSKNVKLRRDRIVFGLTYKSLTLSKALFLYSEQVELKNLSCFVLKINKIQTYHVQVIIKNIQRLQKEPAEQLNYREEMEDKGYKGIVCVGGG